MGNKYRIQLFQDSTYQVIEVNKLIEGESWDGWDDYHDDVVVFQGTLADCEAWLRLNERGYI